MEVYIKSMKMPKSCSDCPMCYDMMECNIAEPIINFFGAELEYFDFCTERHPRCPIIPVPPHGRLIDADAFVDKHFGKEFLLKVMTADEDDLGTALVNIPLVINNAPTIIPACEEVYNKYTDTAGESVKNGNVYVEDERSNEKT